MIMLKDLRTEDLFVCLEITYSRLMVKNSSQNGNAHVVVIIILVVALVGVLGLIFWQNFIYEDSVAPKTGTISQIKTEDDPYEGWNICHDKGVGIIFKYPLDWEFKESAVNPCNTVHPEAGENHVTLVSPKSENSKYIYRIQYFSDTINQALSDTKGQTVLSVTPLGVATSKTPLYLDSYSLDGKNVIQFFLTDHSYAVGEVTDYVKGVSLYSNSIGESYQMTMSMATSDSQQYLGDYTLDEYISQSDYTNALKIFKSISYQ